MFNANYTTILDCILFFGGGIKKIRYWLATRSQSRRPSNRFLFTTRLGERFTPSLA